jgi:protein-L-isoaspartate(D-aspartate) O-methyltransferase
MVKQQIRVWEVLDPTVLELFSTVPRERFVPASFRNLAFSDTRIDLGHGETMMTPKNEARLLQALDVRTSEKVLEIGTGSGYMTALLARMGQTVISIDINGEFVDSARPKLDDLGIDNATLITGDGVDGWAGSAPYDVIAVTASSPTPRPSIESQLTVGGRMFMIIGGSPVMEARLITRTGADDWTSELLFHTELPPLIGAEAEEKFIL